MAAPVEIAASLLLLASTSASFAAARGARDFLRQPDAWFRTDDAERIAANILSWQSPEGGWPKNTNTTVPFAGNRAALKGTFDNGATTDELRFLARMANATRDTNCVAAFERGLAHILKAQYPNGGWPQFYPPPKTTYHRYITFNDDAMVRLMGFVREVAMEDRYAFVDSKQRAAARGAFNRGIDCILKCQVKVEGKLTAWCAQHDEVDLSPRPARTFELASLSGEETVGIVRLLMSLEKPSPQVLRAVEAAVAWLESAEIRGIEVIDEPAPGAPKGKDRKVVNHPGARPMWARFYEIGTNKPIFCGRDGVKKYSLAEIEYERRNGYAWLGYWPESLLADFPEWKRKHAGGAAN